MAARFPRNVADNLESVTSVAVAVSTSNPGAPPTSVLVDCRSSGAQIVFWRPGDAEEVAVASTSSLTESDGQALSLGDGTMVLWSRTGLVQRWDLASHGKILEVNTNSPLCGVSISLLH